jgi:hypothetical protein
MSGAFVYTYPMTGYKNDGGGNFSRTDGSGSTSNGFSICVPNGEESPEFIKVKCIVKDGWDGEYYRIESTVVKFYKRIIGKRPIVYPVILVKK